MPMIKTRVEGNGKTAKTFVTNIDRLAKSLNRDESEVIHFLRCALHINRKSENLSLCGVHRSHELQSHLSSFIEYFVLCGTCRLPETTYAIYGTCRTLHQKCNACGGKTACDSEHVLTQFILDHYPQTDSDEPDEITDSVNAEDEDISEVLNGAINRLKSWRAAHNSCTQSDLIRELKSIVWCNNLSNIYHPVIYIGAFFAGNNWKEIVKYKGILNFLGSSVQAQRELISATEWLCGTLHPSLLSHFPLFLNVLYDEELVDEEVFISWAEDCWRGTYSMDSSLVSDEVLRELRKKATPFMTWIQKEEVGEEAGEIDCVDDTDEGGEEEKEEG